MKTKTNKFDPSKVVIWQNAKGHYQWRFNDDSSRDNLRPSYPTEERALNGARNRFEREQLWAKQLKRAAKIP